MEILIGITAIVGAITGIAGMVISVLSLNHNKIEAINAFYSNDRDSRFIEARRVVHTLPNNYDPIEIQKEFGDKISFLILSFDQAGVLVKKGQLPFWIFSKGGCGIAAHKFYKKLSPYIKHKRKENSLYAVNYEYLYKRINAKVKLGSSGETE